MNKLILAIFLLLSINVYADMGEANVLSVEPVFKTVYNGPRVVCWDEPHVYYRDRRENNRTRKILGAIVGGAIGNAVGHHKVNKKVGTVVGAVLGASVAKDMGRHRRNDSYTYYARECEYHRKPQEVRDGYKVTYWYEGETYVTYMQDIPGATIPVHVSVRPICCGVEKR